MDICIKIHWRVLNVYDPICNLSKYKLIHDERSNLIGTCLSTNCTQSNKITRFISFELNLPSWQDYHCKSGVITCEVIKNDVISVTCPCMDQTSLTKQFFFTCMWRKNKIITVTQFSGDANSTS